MKTRKTFGIDFGTANTRIVFHDGEKEIAIREKDSTVYSIPSVIRYIRGKPVAFGHEALNREDGELIRSIKWLLPKNEKIKVDGSDIEPIQMVADFFNYLRSVVRDASGVPDLTKAFLSVPVEYPDGTEQDLCKACKMAGIEIDDELIDEPVAALYSTHEEPGVFAVFDWGGGSLDVAVVENFASGKSEVKSSGGIKKGGDDFDQIILEKALSHFESEITEHSNLSKSEIEERIVSLKQDTGLLMRVEERKMDLSDSNEVALSRARLVGEYPLNYPFTRQEFEDWIASDIDEGINCLEECIRASGCERDDIKKIMVSGGTCNIPLIRKTLREEFGSDKVGRPEKIKTELDSIDDIGMATAKGTALLAARKPLAARKHIIGMATAKGTALLPARKHISCRFCEEFSFVLDRKNPNLKKLEKLLEHYRGEHYNEFMDYCRRNEPSRLKSTELYSEGLKLLKTDKDKARKKFLEGEKLLLKDSLLLAVRLGTFRETENNIKRLA